MILGCKAYTQVSYFPPYVSHTHTHIYIYIPSTWRFHLPSQEKRWYIMRASWKLPTFRSFTWPSRLFWGLWGFQIVGMSTSLVFLFRLTAHIFGSPARTVTMSTLKPVKGLWSWRSKGWRCTWKIPLLPKSWPRQKKTRRHHYSIHTFICAIYTYAFQVWSHLQGRGIIVECLRWQAAAEEEECWWCVTSFNNRLNTFATYRVRMRIWYNLAIGERPLPGLPFTFIIWKKWTS